MYLAAINGLDSISLGKMLYGSVVRFSSVDSVAGTTSAYIKYDSSQSGCIWTTTNTDDSLFTIEESYSNIGSFFLKTSDGKYVQNAGRMTVVDTPARGFVFDVRGVFGNLLMIGIRAEDNNSRIPDSGIGFTNDIIEYSSSNEGELTVGIHTAAESLLGGICVGSFLGNTQCSTFCTNNADECKQRKTDFCVTKEGAGTKMCQLMYGDAKIVTSTDFDSIYMKNAMIEKCFDDLKATGLSTTDFINSNKICACFLSDGFYNNLAKSMGKSTVNSRLLFPACQASNFVGEKVGSDVVHVDGTGAVVGGDTKVITPPPSDGSSRKPLRNLELVIPIILGVIILVVIVIWLIYKRGKIE